MNLSSNKLLYTETGYKNPVKVEEDEYSFIMTAKEFIRSK